MKRTPLFEAHSKLGGKIIDFGGWELPVHYTGIIEEHEQVRSAAGLFDVSHMGEIAVKGPAATKFIQRLVTNDITGAKVNQAIYSPMCYPDGGVVDDLLVYKLDEDSYLLVVNASNTEKDFEWICNNLEEGVEVENISDKYAQLAIQGPKAQGILQKLTATDLKGIKFYHFYPSVDISGINALVSRTGYTGEDGFELYIASDDAKRLWNMLLNTGSADGLVPIGLGARDTLRFEAALPLYGHELSPEISPLQAGLGRFVKLTKEAFIGKDELARQKEEGPGKILAGFEMLDRGIPRSQYEIQKDGRNIGVVTTGSFSPSLKKNLGLAMVEGSFSEEGTEFDVIIRGKPLKAKVTKIPFYTKKYRVGG